MSFVFKTSKQTWWLLTGSFVILQLRTWLPYS